MQSYATIFGLFLLSSCCWAMDNEQHELVPLDEIVQNNDNYFQSLLRPFDPQLKERPDFNFKNNVFICTKTKSEIDSLCEELRDQQFRTFIEQSENKKLIRNDLFETLNKIDNKKNVAKRGIKGFTASLPIFMTIQGLSHYAASMYLSERELSDNNTTAQSLMSGIFLMTYVICGCQINQEIEHYKAYKKLEDAYGQLKQEYFSEESG